MNLIRNILAAIVRFFDAQRLIAIAVLAAIIVIRFWDPAPVEILRLKTFDLYQQIKPREGGPRPVVIVDIDDASLEEIGQWPWPRHILAKILENLTRAGTIAIGLDIVLAEPDRTSPDLIAKTLPDLSDMARAELSNAPNHDKILSDVILRSRTVLGVSAYNPVEGTKLRAEFKPKAKVATLGGDPKPFLLNFPNPLGNIAVLEGSAKGRGMLTFRPDPDGIVRRVPLIMRAGDYIMPAMSFELLRLATGQGAYMIRSTPAGIKDVVIARRPIPTDRNGFLWVHFTPHEPARYVSAKDVLANTVPPARLKGKIVLIGTSSSGLLDIKATPLEAAMPGVEIHAQVLENVFSGRILKRPVFLLGAEVVGLAIAGLLLIIFLPIVGAVPSLIGGIAVSAGAIGTAWWAYDAKDLLVDVAYPLLGSAVIFWLLVFWNYTREEKQKGQIRSAFGQYISPDLVEELAKDPSRLTLGGQTLEMSILFSDVRGFTAISEQYKTDPQGLTNLMNRFLTPISDAIMEKRGTIDKYMGDAVMAFWNAPLSDPDHARNACDAALLLLEEVEKLNVIRKQESEETEGEFLPLNVGVGVNTGECVVGNMGSKMRFDYSVLGDSVNLASRLEGQTKSYGVRTILGEATAQAAGDGYAIIELDLIRVKGKTEPERIFALFGDSSVASAPEFIALADKNQAMLVAYRAQDWAGAEEAANAAKAIGTPFSLDELYDMHLERIAEFRASPPGGDWDGVFTATSK